MKDETKIELMKIAAQLTTDTINNLGKGIRCGDTAPNARGVDIKEIFSTCLAHAKDRFDDLGQ